MLSEELLTSAGCLKRLAPYSEGIYRAWRSAVANAHGVFRTQDGTQILPYEPWLFCHHARAHAIQYLGRELSSFNDITVFDQTIMSSVVLRTSDGIELLFRKSDEGEVPVPGASSRRQKWFSQPLPGLGVALNELHLVATWDIDELSGEFAGVVLSMPASGGGTRDSVVMHWEADFPETPIERAPDLTGYRHKEMLDTQLQQSAERP